MVSLLTLDPMPFDTTLPFASSTQTTQLEPEYAEAFGAWQATPTPQTRSQLLKQVDPVISTAIKSYGGASAGSPVLRSHARRMALKSFGTYDPAKGGLKTHLLSQLRRLQRTGAQQAQIISVPEQVALDRRHLNETEQSLRITLGREPSDQQLANHTGLSLKRLSYVRQTSPPVAVGKLLSQMPAESRTLPASSIPGHDPLIEGWEELVYHDLDQTDQVIFDYLTGSHGRGMLNTGDIAKRLGVTPSAVSQRAARIQGQLDERLSVGVL